MSLPGSPVTPSSSSAKSVLITRCKSPRASSKSDSDTPSLDSCMYGQSSPGNETPPPGPEIQRLQADLASLRREVDETWNTPDNMVALQFTLSNDRDHQPEEGDNPHSPQDVHGVQGIPLEPPATPEPHAESPGERLTPTKSKKPFHKWMKTLRRRGTQRRRALNMETHASVAFHFTDAEASQSEKSGHQRQSSSDSSVAFITGMKSASISLASISLFGRSRRTTVMSSRAHSRTDRSSRASMSAMRASEDSQGPGTHNRGLVLDPVVAERSMQRRRVLEELITTEESYIGDVRFLMNVYVTILASLPTQTPGLRSSINRNMTEILELHEELLGELHRAVPHSEYTQIELPARSSRSSIHGHQRWRSLDSVPEDNGGMSWLQDVTGMTVDSQVVAEVAKIFTLKMNRFFVYEEYGAKYELMMKDVAFARRTLPDWDKYQKGLEALAGSLGPENSQDDQSRKSLTVGDLLVKPIQRVCKYPLLFAELLKHTPVIDCPHSHMVIEDTLLRLREATGEINRATDDPQIKSTLERTWLLQDRLVFPNQRLDAVSKNRIRSFGHIRLCGVLHICWQTKESVTGQYLICLLYREWLCIASASRADQIYTILVCITLANVKIEDADNGRGLQCHTAPFSWKIVFECDYQLYEIIMTACTPKELQEWRTRFDQSTAKNVSNHNPTGPTSFSALSLNIKSLGTVFGKPGTIARRISIHRATTVGPKSALCQVILKNTSVEKDAGPAASSKLSINRSQSLLAPSGRIPVLAPSRGDRARLEALLSDVWTREVLPFPGMTVRARSEHLVRASASSMIRKLSVASITSSFTKRSVSLASSTKAGAALAMGAGANGDDARAAAAEVVEDGWWSTSVIDEKADATLEGPGVVHDVAAVPVLEFAPVREEGGEVSPTGLADLKFCYSDTAVNTLGIEEARSPGGGRLDPGRRQPSSQALRAASPNSSRLSLSCPGAASGAPKGTSAASSRNSPSNSEKENCFQVPKDTCPGGCKVSSIKSVGRWSKVGSSRRGVMVQGIRSFFR